MGIDACSTIEDLIDIANQKTQELNNGSGVLILTDMFGGSPSNITQALVQHNDVQGVSGVNLPMLVRAITYRHENLETVVKKALSGGGEGVLKLEESQETRVC
jgi:PTS system ascorbate-specific IIA component